MTPAPTNGWDLVYAVRLPQVNARIAEENASPKAFSGTCEGATVAGSFGTWQITQGGSDYLVLLSVPVTGTVTASGMTPFPFSATIKLEVELNYLTSAGGAATQQALQIRQPDSQSSSSSDLFSIKAVTFASATEIGAEIYLRSALGDWLTANPGVFNHVFAVVDLAAVAAEAPYAWLKPTSLSYAYSDAADENDCLLAILAMTQGRSSANLDQEVTPAAVPDGNDAALLISSRLLLDDIIRDALPVTFPGTLASDFVLASDRPALTLGKPRQLSSIDCQGTTYQPLLESFSVEFQGGQILCQSQTSIPVGDGVTAYTSVTATQGLTLTTNSTGQQTIAFTEIGQPVVNHWTTTDPNTDQANQAIGTAIIIGGVVASLFTGGVAGICIILGSVLVGGVVANLPQLIADWTPETAPSLDLMAENIADPFTWTGGASFAAAAADLCDSVRLSGTPWPAAATS